VPTVPLSVVVTECVCVLVAATVADVRHAARPAWTIMTRMTGMVSGARDDVIAQDTVV